MTQATGLKRGLMDKYYTTETIVKLCVNLIKTHVIIDKEKDICIEPSAGNGSFINYLKLLFLNYRFYDIEPEHEEILKQDYFTLDNTNFTCYTDNNLGKIHVIGNPPFGRQSSLAIKFIKKSAEYCDSISFILPKSFKKDSLKNNFPVYFHLVCEYDLPENSFMVNNKYHDVPCVFQIWVKKDEKRVITEKLIPIGYRFVKNDEDHDISFRRVGVYAGEIDKNTEKKSVPSHYFIKFDNPLTKEQFDTLSNINYDCKNNTVGPKSISKQELIKEFNKILG